MMTTNPLVAKPGPTANNERMNQPTLPIFVYGTLKRGEQRERCWPHSPLKVESATTRGRLFKLDDYPAMIPGDDLILGELWTIHSEHLSETLRVLDAIEWFGQDDVDLYARVIVECRGATGDLQRAYTYYYAAPEELPAQRRILPDSNGICSWTAHR
jgi:gamma-glutamylcyclotransferase (GGCT)/AIG2-like uncharacterized protein YtfP